MGKIIKITEEQFKRLFEETEQLLVEYAIPKNEAVVKAQAIWQQVLENWCLIDYLRITQDGRLQINRAHWGGELVTHLNNMARLNIKGNNTPKARVSAFGQAWEKCGLDNAKIIIKRLQTKFAVKEKINAKLNVYEEIAMDFISAKDTLLSLVGILENNDDKRRAMFVEYASQL